MPRIARVVIPDCPHHVTQRGNRREDVFFSDADRRRYLQLLREYSRKHRLQIQAYCLMSNHVHLVAVPLTADSLSGAMKPLHLRYAQHANDVRRVTGRVWQGRFFSCPLDDEHLWTAVRYVERNPVRVGLVNRAEDWPWSSAAARCGMRVDDLLSDPCGLTEQVSPGQWSGFLREPWEDEAALRRLRDCTRTGRPAGTDGFISRLERLLSRRLRALPRGRPRKPVPEAGKNG